jgi:hypothetical protein
VRRAVEGPEVWTIIGRVARLLRHRAARVASNVPPPRQAVDLLIEGVGWIYILIYLRVSVFVITGRVRYDLSYLPPGYVDIGAEVMVVIVIARLTLSTTLATQYYP